MHHGILKVISGETMITPDDVRLYILVNIVAKLIKIPNKEQTPLEIHLKAVLNKVNLID